MKTTLKKAGILGALGTLTLGIMSVSAMGFGGMSNLSSDEIATRQSTMFTRQATLLGISVEEIKSAWATGKDFKTLAKEKGITEAQLQTKLQAERDAQLKTHLATLVTKGVITQAQADQRLAFMQTSKATGKLGGKRGHGMMGDFRF